ncbi:MAG: TIGR04452 family lipoprotein, partial [Spirochaetia bacterium]|nr:TIGR04452 family lipoprotein [Spirochaetia bacterium]
MIKKINLLIPAAFAILFFQTCIITDQVVQPVDSVSGKDLIKDVQKASQEGFLLGIAANPNSALMLSTSSGLFPLPILMSGISGNLLARNLGIDEKKDYKKSSAEACVNSVRESYFAVMVGGIEPPPLTGG